jgi:hypothetical protein
MKEYLMSEEHVYYKTHQKYLIEGHVGEFVAIIGNNVLGYHKNYRDAFQSAVEQYPLAKSYFVKRCLPVGEPEDVLMSSNEYIATDS